VAPAEQAVRVRVVDRGAGVSDERAGELFEPFFTTKPEGTGLGLAMVKQLAELHGGTAAVSSAEGEGACFAVWLPLRAPAQIAVANARLSIGSENAVAKSIVGYPGHRRDALGLHAGRHL
jgi:K+-sensing histidine kinase KdpD